MKIRILTLVFGISFLIMTNESRSQTFIEGKHYLQGAYGFGNLNFALLSFIDNYSDVDLKMMGPFFLKYEYAVNHNLGIGINTAFASARMKYYDNTMITPSGEIYEEIMDWNTYSILARVNIHFGNDEVIDPYWGFGMGHRNASRKYSNNDSSQPLLGDTNTIFPLGFETTFGCRFMFSESFGAFTEIGFAKAIFQFGIVSGF